MITQDDLNREIDLSKKIYLEYLYKLATYLSIGSGSYVRWYIDLCVLYYLTDALQSIRLDSNKLYLGNYEVNENFYALVTKHIHEFITYDIREVVYAELDTDSKVKDFSSPMTPPILVTYQPNEQQWQSIDITIETDDITQLTLPFNISDVVSATVMLTVGDGDPLYIVNENEEGYHIVGNTLFWHTYYNLKIGDVINIKYLLNV